MSLMGYTPGGSPIFSGNFGSSKRASGSSKKLYICSVDPKHKATKNQAKSSGGFCMHCGSWLQEYKPVLRKDASALEKQIYDLQLELEAEKRQMVVDRRNMKKMKVYYENRDD